MERISVKVYPCPIGSGDPTGQDSKNGKKKKCIIMKVLYYLLPLFIIAATSCTNNKDNFHAVAGEEEKPPVAVSGTIPKMAEIDIQKDYPKKKLLLDEIADIEYIPLETSDSVLLGSFTDVAFSGDMVVLADNMGTVFFFNRQGKFLRSFNHKGQGDKEYTNLINMCVDFEREEVFIYDYYLRYRILVYSFDGEFKRELKLEGSKRWVNYLFPYDETHLVSYDTCDENYKNPSGESFNRYPYFLIDKQSGEITSLPLKVDKRITNQIKWEDGDGNYKISGVGILNWMKADMGIYVSDFALDTIYHCTGDKITPKAVRKNNPDKSRCLSSLCFESNRYTFFDVFKVHVDEAEKRLKIDVNKKMLFDKRDGNMYDVNIVMKDFAEGKFAPDITSAGSCSIPEGYYFSFLTSERLYSLLEQGILKGKIKEIAENMEEDANPVMVIAKFKE